MKRLVTLLGVLAAATGCQQQGQLKPLPRLEIAEEPAAAGDLRRDYVVLPPEVYAAERARAGKGGHERHGGTHVLYVNFDGATLRSGTCSNSQANCSSIISCNGQIQFPAYTATNRAQVLELLSSWMAPYNVEIVTERPASGSYTMAMVGGTSQTICYETGEACGVAPMECTPFTDAGSSNHIVFAFTNCGRDTLTIASTIAQEAAHAWGLEHTDNPRDALYPYLNPQTEGFLDQTMNIVGNGSGGDRSVCTGATTQNSHQRMLEALGPSGPDTAPPTVRFLEPQDGAEVPPTFAVRIEAMDNSGAPRVDLVVDEGTPAEMRAMATQPPYQWNVSNFGAGPHTFKATATDGVNMTATTQIRVTVVAQGGGGMGGAGAGMAGAGGGEAGSGGGAAGSGGGEAGSGGGEAGSGGGEAGSGGGAAGSGGGAGQGGTPGSAGSGGGGTPDDVGAECERNSECASRLCAKIPGEDLGVCTAQCERDEDCGEDARIICEEFAIGSRTDRVCVPDNFLDGQLTKKASCAAVAGARAPSAASLFLLVLAALALGLRRRQ